MLKNIPPILSPELLKVLCEMGHGDCLVIGDGNFPAQSSGRDAIVVRCDGHGVAALLEAILTVMPLDTYVDQPVGLMDIVPADRDRIPRPVPIWKEYYRIIETFDARGEAAVEYIERFDFYARAKTAYAVVATGESAIYANVMLQKGVV